MRLRVAPNRLISEIQTEFNQTFPFLKLEFYQQKAQNGNHHIGPLIKPPYNKRIGSAQSMEVDGEIEITKEMTVKDVEKMFMNQFSLNTQVFRRSGSVWLQTTMTDGWTLEKQNEHGRELSISQKMAIPTEDDLQQLD